MTLTVMKFGGTSVQSPAHMRRIAQEIAARHAVGEQIVVVVSAMGDMTDRLVEHVAKLTDDPAPREIDLVLSSGEQISSGLLALAIQDEGVDAIALTGRQAGIVTDGRYTRARVAGVHGERVRQELQQGRVVVVAGYQGISEQGETTTLGRGGSDTTAVVLAGALGADECEICTDVDHVLSADPRIVPDAVPLKTLSHEHMERLARLGAGVLHPRAVEEARKRGVAIRLRGAFSEEEGTLVTDLKDAPPAVAVTGRDDILLVEVEGSGTELPELMVPPEDILSRVQHDGHTRLLVAVSDITAGPDVLADDLSQLDIVEGRPRHLGLVALVANPPAAQVRATSLALDAIEQSGVQVHEQHQQADATFLLVDPGRMEEAIRTAHDAVVKVVAR